MTPTKDLITYTPSAEALVEMLATKPDYHEAHCISDIPPTPHHHHDCRECHITLACFEIACAKTTDLCHDCATGDERPWSAQDALRAFERKRAEEARQRLVEALTERLGELPNESLVKVASFIEEEARGI